MVAGQESYGALKGAALAVADGKIAWLGPRKELPGQPEDLARNVIDAEELAGGRSAWMTPGLVDCHTHLVYGGSRAREFELRLEGASYEEISRAGGGIRATVTATRTASEETLFVTAAERAERLMSEGVTTLEIKSGYGLDVATEIKMLRVARELGKALPLEVRTTFLGAHALPSEFDGNSQGYIDLVCDQALPAAAAEGLVDAVDAFCEGIGFSLAETRQVFEAAKRRGLPVKLHAEQLSDLKGSLLAAEFGALSADHLEFLGQDGVDALAAAGSVAVLLPGAFYFLRETQLPPIPALRAAGVPIALASDSNPGSSPVTSLLLMLNMACTLFRMTPEEALAGITRNGAAALGLAADRGTLEVGKRADLALWAIGEPAELAYRIGDNPLLQRVLAGEITDQR
jgi:imidazolonepropionase|tara:strand:- start:4673 stop:5878 length:1206 start_codon:yes stop_codon:yes gene_type:complete